MANILIVDDDPDLTSTVSQWLQLDNYIVEVCSSGQQSIEQLARASYDLLILDIGLPDCSGVEICARFRNAGGAAPVLFLTGDSSIDSKELGFDAGADDYLTKPFNLRELTVRVRALLKRGATGHSSVLKYQDLSLDPANFSFVKGGKEILLPPKEFELLEFFMKHPEESISASILLNQLWPGSPGDSVDAITSAVDSLRKKIDRDNRELYIKNTGEESYKLQRQD